MHNLLFNFQLSAFISQHPTLSSPTWVATGIRTGATLLDRSFLWTHKKLISTMWTNLKKPISTLSSYPKTNNQMRIVLNISPDLLIMDRDASWNCINESYQLSILCHSDSTMPLKFPAWRLQRPERTKECNEIATYIYYIAEVRPWSFLSLPFQKFWRIVKSKQAVVILHVVLI